MSACNKTDVLSFFAPREIVDIDLLDEDIDFTQLSEAEWRWAQRQRAIKIEDDPAMGVNKFTDKRTPMLPSPGHEIRNARELHRMAAWEAAPTPANHPVAQHVELIGQLFPGASSSNQALCARCNAAIPDHSECVGLNKVECHVCHFNFHWHCVDLVRPPKRRGWHCGCAL